MELMCPVCFTVRIITPEEQRQIVAELKTQGPAAQRLMDCEICHRGQWGLALARPRCAA